MLKKMMLLALSIGALIAFAVPAAASAARLTDANGLVPVETTITATSTNAITHLAIGVTLECEHVEIHGIVTVNALGIVEVSMDEEGSDSATGCVVNAGGTKTPTTVAATFESLNAEGTGPGTASFSFVTPECTEATTGASNEVTWNGTDVISITAAVNGTCGPGTLTGTFTVTDSNGPVTVEN